MADLVRPIRDVACALGLKDDELEPYGNLKAKIALDAAANRASRPDGKLVLVSAINPTPAGEGKTTTTIGLGQALGRLKREHVICLREPSLGPCFGVKGGATGGGKALLVPADDINMHFTGDFHAITSAHNLIAAMLDNHLHQGNALGFEPRSAMWRRVMDMNDRALRNVIVGLGGKAHGVPRETGFDITPASEIMAILCLSRDAADLRLRLARTILGLRKDGSPITIADLKLSGALMALLKDAIKPNLVQTVEGTPALVHGGPFANIAHGCSSVIATRLGLKLAPMVLTEAGFGFDLGGEKFLDIKCRLANLKPDAVVIVSTVRALKMHGGVPKKDLEAPSTKAVEKGFKNLEKHLENAKSFGLPTLVALNRFAGDAPEEEKLVAELARGMGVEAVLSEVFAHGGAGGVDLAEALGELLKRETSKAAPLYPDSLPPREKIETVARRVYGATGVSFAPEAEATLARVKALGLEHFPVCIAKTQYSLSDNPELLGRPTGFDVRIRELRIAAGAGFLVAVAGDIMTMPGLPKAPAAERMDVDASGAIVTT